MIGQRAYNILPQEIKGTSNHNLTVTSGYYNKETGEEAGAFGLRTHIDTNVGPCLWLDIINKKVDAEENFGTIPPLSFKPDSKVSLSTILYYPIHPKKGFEFVLPTISDIDAPDKPLELCPEPHDILIMDNVKTFPYSSTRNIMLPATASLHKVNAGTEDKTFIALFFNA